MRKWHVKLRCEYTDDIEAETEAQAVSKASLYVEGSGTDVYVVGSSAREILYERPAGTDRWAAVAEEIRFGESRFRWFTDSGSWWWSDGSAAVRCDLPEPQDPTYIVRTTLNAVIGDHLRRVALWRSPEKHGGLLVCRDRTDRHIAVADHYRRLVECGYPDAEWHVVRESTADPATVPILAIAGGQIVGVVAGVRVS